MGSFLSAPVRGPGRLGRGLLAIALAISAAGCGDPALWDRYRAERDFWRAQRLLDRIERDPVAEAALVPRAAAALERIVERNPHPGGTVAGYRLEVALISGRAANALARLARLQGREREAASAYARVRERYRGILPVTLEAAEGRAEALAAAGSTREAAAAYAEIAREYPLVDPEREIALSPVLEAPVRAARLLAQEGEAAAADGVLREAVMRYDRALDPWQGRGPEPDLWLGLSEVHAARGDLDASLDALRRVWIAPGAGQRAAQALVGLVERSLAGGRPDSALVYAARAEHDLADANQGKAMLLGAQAWEAVGRPDAALDAYQRFLDHFPQSADSAALARFRRGDLLERIGRWEQARSELRTLAATHPSHPLGFAALIRIVEHHERVGEGELAAYEGRRALETVDQVIAAHRDAAVQVRARTARAELLLLIGEPHAAFDALADTWRNHAGAPGAAEAGLRAAEVAESRLGDEELAAGLCREIAERAADPELRRRAAAAGARLTRMRR